MSAPGTLRRGLAAGLVLPLLLGGCASIPTDSPVYTGEGQDDGGGPEDPYVRLIPVPPRPGSGETDLVRDFLSSMGSFEEDYSAARAYLTPDQEAEWDPDGTALVYDERATTDIELADGGDGGDGADDAEAEEGAAPTAEVRLEATRTATIRADGRYVPAGPDDELEATFQLRQVDGEWRIDEPPEELILSGQAVERVYRPLNLYFLNEDESALVPDTVLLPGHASSNLADQLARRLVVGPTSWLDPAVHTAFPDQTTADTAYQAGTLTVDLSPAATMSSSDERFGMAAQLAWTLRQVPEVQELRMRTGGEDMEIPGADSDTVDVSSGLWDSVDPSGAAEIDGAEGLAYVTRDGALLAMDEEQTERQVPGAAGVGASIDQHALSLGEDRTAGIDTEAQEVRVAEIAGDAEYSTVLSGEDYRALSWDGNDDLWVAAAQEQSEVPDEAEQTDSGPTGSRLWVLRDGIDPVEVDVPELDGTSGAAVVQRLRLAPDGARVAAVLDTGEGSRLVVGRVVEGPDGPEVSELLPVGTGFAEVTDVAWRGPDQLAVLAEHEDNTPQAYLIPSGGSGEATSAGALPGVEMESIAAMPNRPLLAGADDNEVWLTDDRLTWQPAGEGTNPIYPG